MIAKNHDCLCIFTAFKDGKRKPKEKIRKFLSSYSQTSFIWLDLKTKRDCIHPKAYFLSILPLPGLAWTTITDLLSTGMSSCAPANSALLQSAPTSESAFHVSDFLSNPSPAKPNSVPQLVSLKVVHYKFFLYRKKIWSANYYLQIVWFS